MVICMICIIEPLVLIGPQLGDLTFTWIFFFLQPILAEAKVLSDFGV